MESSTLPPGRFSRWLARHRLGVRVSIVFFALADLVLLGLAINYRDTLQIVSSSCNLFVAVTLWPNLTIAVPNRVRRWDEEHAAGPPVVR